MPHTATAAASAYAQIKLDLDAKPPAPADRWDATAHAPNVRPAHALYRQHADVLDKLPEPLAARLAARNASTRQGARLDAYLLRLLALSVGDDGVATADQRWLAGHAGRTRAQVRKRLARLTAEGSLRLVRHGASHTSAAYEIADFAASLRTRQGGVQSGQGGGSPKGSPKTPANRSARESSVFTDQREETATTVRQGKDDGRRPRSTPKAARPAAVEESSTEEPAGRPPSAGVLAQLAALTEHLRIDLDRRPADRPPPDRADNEWDH